MSRPIPYACFPRRLCPLTRAVTVCWAGVRYFVGLRTTDHPLFQVDKLLTKAQQKLPDDVDIEKWIDSVEGLNSHLAKINELAYTSSFGEYNPGGGKGQVRKYLLLAKEEVEQARDSLKVMIELLKL